MSGCTMVETGDILRESIKLIRNSKGFTWEIRLMGNGANGLFTDDDLKRLKAREEELFQEYGSKE